MNEYQGYYAKSTSVHCVYVVLYILVVCKRLNVAYGLLLLILWNLLFQTFHRGWHKTPRHRLSTLILRTSHVSRMFSQGWPFKNMCIPHTPNTVVDSRSLLFRAPLSLLQTLQQFYCHCLHVYDDPKLSRCSVNSKTVSMRRNVHSKLG